MQNEQERGVLFLTGRGKNKPAKRQKCQQGGIIGQKHRPEHGDDHQCCTYAPNRGKGVYHPLRKSGKDLQVSQSTYHRQNTEQTGKRFEVVIA